jgi:hypothetical protein
MLQFRTDDQNASKAFRRTRIAANSGLKASAADGISYQLFANFSISSSGRTKPSIGLIIEHKIKISAAVIGGRNNLPHLL